MESPEQIKEHFRGLNLIPIRNEGNRGLHISFMSPYLKKKKNVLHSQRNFSFHYSGLYKVI